MNQEEILRQFNILVSESSSPESFAKDSSLRMTCYGFFINGINCQTAYQAEMERRANQVHSAQASKQEQESKQIATLILGGLDCGEYSDIDIEFLDLKDAEELQEKLVKDCDSVRIPLYVHQPKTIEPAQDNEGWITFNDGGRPVLHHCFVDVKLSDGSFIYKTMAGVFGWRWVDGCVNIIAYRIAK